MNEQLLPKRMVVDASIAVSATRKNEEKHNLATIFFETIERRNVELVEPSLFLLEVSTSLIRSGVDRQTLGGFLKYFGRFIVRTHVLGPKTIRKVIDDAFDSRLRASDAVYVWLATKEKIPLATFDDGMKAAAQKRKLLFALENT